MRTEGTTEAGSSPGRAATPPASFLWRKECCPCARGPTSCSALCILWSHGESDLDQLQRPEGLARPAPLPGHGVRPPFRPDRAVSTAGFPGPAEGRADPRRWERASRDGELWNPGRSPTWPSRLVSPQPWAPRPGEAPPRAPSPVRGLFPLPASTSYRPPRGARPSLLQTRSHPLGARKRPGAAPSAAHVSARGKSRESAVPPPLPLATECANERGGGRSGRQRCRRHYPLCLRCTDVAVVLASRSPAAPHVGVGGDGAVGKRRVRGTGGRRGTASGSGGRPGPGGLSQAPRPASPKGVAGGRRGSGHRH